MYRYSELQASSSELCHYSLSYRNNPLSYVITLQAASIILWATPLLSELQESSSELCYYSPGCRHHPLNYSQLTSPSEKLVLAENWMTLWAAGVILCDIGVTLSTSYKHYPMMSMYLWCLLLKLLKHALTFVIPRLLALESERVNFLKNAIIKLLQCIYLGFFLPLSDTFFGA
jgi:hypothetical protein